MQTVSENWKNAHKQTLLNESFVEISLDIADPDALVDGVPQDNGAIYISNSSELTVGGDVNPSPYCTLEQNLWCLDGSRKAIPESDFEKLGYASDVLSDDTCVFGTKRPTITIEFSKVFSKLIPGVTIVWSNTYGEWADTFEVIAYNGSTIVASKEVTKNRSIKSIILTDIIEYDKIAIVIKKWCLPNHRARIEEIFIGLNKVYGKSDLFAYSHSQSVDPVSTALPKNEINFSIDNTDGEYNPYNTEGLSKYIIERQEIKVRYGLRTSNDTIEWIKGGAFYLSEWNAKQNGLTAEFKARDLLEFMSAIYYDPITTITKRSLYDLAVAVLSSADLPLNGDGAVRWVVDDSLKSIYTMAPLPQDTFANCLQLIANAGECVLYQDRDGTLHIEPLKFDETDYTIDSSNSYSKPEINLSKTVKEVRAKVYAYYKSEDKFASTTSEIIKVVGAAGETITLDNPLITDGTRAASYLNWIATHLGHRMTLDSSWRVDVRLDALDIVKNINDYNANSVRMTEIKFDYNGAFRGTGKGKVI